MREHLDLTESLVPDGPDDLPDSALALAFGPDQTPPPDGRLTLVPGEAGTASGAPARYELHGEIARGGMGAVLRGRDPDLGRDLAVKVLLEENRANPAAVRRFVGEAQIGGRLQHPGIVPVYDLGRFADGRPYFTMKLVRGQTLAALLAARRDPAEDRPRFLHVFEQVCQTVAYAHSMGVIHRDLKPSNVMVGEFGEVQVMDWGLAKQLRPADGGAREDDPGPPSPVPNSEHPVPNSDQTRSGLVLGTLAYMPPEQARGESERVDERADVFALGGILCVILTGYTPYVTRDPTALARMAARGELGDTLMRLDLCRADRDLVGLCRRCLEPDPADRPRDAGAVAAEVAAHFAGAERRVREAELAGAEARARAAEERKRRRLTLALAAVLLAVGVTAGITAVWSESARYRRQEERTGQVHAALEEAAEWFGRAQLAPPEDLVPWERADAATERARGLLDAGDVAAPAVEQARRLIAAVDAGKARAEARAAGLDRDRRMLADLEEIRLLQTELEDVRLDRARALAGYGRVFREYGIDPARPAEAADRLRTSPIRPALLAALDDWIALDPDGDARAGLVALARAADPDLDGWPARLRAALAARDTAALNELAEKVDVAAVPPTTLALLGRALVAGREWAAAEPILRAAHRKYAGDFWVVTELADCLLSSAESRPGDRKRLADEAVRFYTAALALRPASAGVHNRLGMALAAAGRHADAESAYRAAVQLSPGYAVGHNNLGKALLDRGSVEDAAASFREAVRLSPDFATAHNNLGSALDRLGRPDDALAAYDEAVKRRETYALPHANAGAVLLKLGKADEADGRFRRALEIDPEQPFAHNGRGILLGRRKQYKEAEAHFREAVRARPEFAQAHLGLADSLLGQGRPAEAEAPLREAIRLDPALHPARMRLGRVLLGQNKPGDAETVWRELLRLQPDHAEAAVSLGLLLARRHRLDEAETVLRDLLARKPGYAQGHAILAGVLASRGRPADAEAAARQAILLHPNQHVGHTALGAVLRRTRQFSDSLAAYRKAQGLTAPNTPDRRAADRELREAERLLALDAKLSAVLRGEDLPADGAGRAELADFALRHSGRPDAAARLYREAFAADPDLAGDPAEQHRYNAACAAARAAVTGAHSDRGALRMQALDWLTADLARWADPGRPPAKQSPAEVLAHWQADPDLAGVRDEAALAALHGLERAAWRKLWADVEAARRSAARRQ